MADMTTDQINKNLEDAAKAGDSVTASKLVETAAKNLKENATKKEVTEVINSVKTLTQNISKVTVEVGEKIMAAVDTLLDSVTKMSEKKKEQKEEGKEEESILSVEAGKTFIAAVDRVSEELIVTNKTASIIKPNIALVAVPVRRDNGYVGLTANGSSSSTQISKESDPSNISAPFSISVPTSVTKHSVKFTFLPNSLMLAAAANLSGGQRLSPQVLSAKVGAPVRNLPKDSRVVIRFRVAGACEASCVFWDTSRSSLSSEGCDNETMFDGNSTAVTCRCNHLTNFALLTELSKNVTLSEGFLETLTVLTYLGTCLSVLGLVLTIATYIKFKQLRKSLPGKILLCLASSLLMANLVFIFGSWYKPRESETDWNCKVVGMLIHYCYLATMLWSSAEAVHLYRAVMKVFDAHISNFILKASAVAWGVPALIVVITASSSLGSGYGLIEKGSTYLCFVKGNAFIGGFAVPILLLMVANVVVFALVLHKMSSSSRVHRADGKVPASQVRGALGICVLLGLTWVFGFLAVNKVTSYICQPLFVVIHTLQGAVIFLIYCLMKQEALQAWSRYLPCLTRLLKPDRIATTGASGNSRNVGMPSTSTSKAPSSKQHTCVAYSAKGDESSCQVDVVALISSDSCGENTAEDAKKD